MRTAAKKRKILYITQSSLRHGIENHYSPHISIVYVAVFVRKVGRTKMKRLDSRDRNLYPYLTPTCVELSRCQATGGVIVNAMGDQSHQNT